jgi:diketogulonate reductase-like aldo/keto reductase
MRQVRFGPTGRDVPVIGQGTWNLERDDEREAIRALREGLDLGLTHIDTAELYGAGAVERIVGRAIEGRRDATFLVSKVLPSNASYSAVIRACEKSLARLGTDRLDVYLLHWRGGVALEETFRAFEDLESSGKILAFGVSNFDVDDVEEALSITGPGRIACNQVLYHLGQRSIEHPLVQVCADAGLAVVAYSPFASGNFPSPDSRGRGVLESIGESHDASAYQIALAFLMQQSGVVPIPKAARVAHVRDNAAASRIVLDRAEMNAIDRAFPLGRRRRLAML